jgi:hypothetical protein
MNIDKVEYLNGKPFIFINAKRGKERQFGKIVTCLFCGKKTFSSNYKISKNMGKFCSTQCSGKAFGGEKSPVWNGGRGVRTNGYVEVTIPNDHPLKLKGKRYISEHRLVMEKYLNRYLKPYELIHHLNGNKEDNRIENLALCSKKSHYEFIEKMQERIRILEAQLKKE